MAALHSGDRASPEIDALAELVTGRSRSLFAAALEHGAAELSERLTGARVLVCGGAGTIGGETVRLLAGYRTAALHVIDLSENYLADLVRDLRNASSPIASKDFRTYTLDYGGASMANLLAHEPSYDAILNFAAHKHVRGERDGYTLLSMVETNILKLAAFKERAVRAGHRGAFFSVSTDKAANPSSLMGASKRVMEDVLFEHARAPGSRTTTARFANVAFSNGSLLQAVLRRLSRGEPIAVPEATRRYFVSPRESGELCLLASMLGEDRTITIPDLNPERELVDLQQIVEGLLTRLGREPILTRDESEAREIAVRRGPEEPYPVLLTPLDTGGEKPFEEFVAEGESARPWRPGLKLIDRVTGPPVEAVLARLGSVGPGSALELAGQVRAAIQEAVERFSHRASERNLDQRL